MQFSVSAIVQIAAIPLLGAVGAGLVALVPAITDSTTTVKRIFNAAQRVLLVLSGSFAYSAVGGVALPARVDVDLLALAMDVVVAAAVAALMNTALLAGVLQRDSGGTLAFILRNVLLRVGSSYAVSYVAAYILVVLWSPARLGWVSALFFLPSILVIQWSLRQLAGEWRIQHEVLAPFVTSLDLRHPGAAESSRLAAGAASAIAAGMGVARPSFVERVVMSARLRDVGLLTLEHKPAAIVRRDHAAASTSVLGDVGFLEGPLTYIAGHHERVDGQGRPEGLVGEQIPLGSRVLAVADAWSDAVMAGHTAEEAVGACEDRVGESLDEVCVNALRRAHGRGQLPAVEAR